MTESQKEYKNRTKKMMQQQRSKNNKFKCNQCHKEFVSQHSLKVHTIEHLSCSKCDQSFVSMLLLRKHMEYHAARRLFQCNQCDKAFILEHILKQHMKTHSVKMPYQCSQCDNVFLLKCDLVKHSEMHDTSIHRQYRSIDNSSKRNIEVKRMNIDSAPGETGHLKETKIVEKYDPKYIMNYTIAELNEPKCGDTDLFKCILGYKNFTSKEYLQIHLMEHLRCIICDKPFLSMSRLKDHMKIHTYKKPNTCFQCDKVCLSKHLLKQHMIIHNGEKPYQCKFKQCDKTFSQKLDLVNHVKIHIRENYNQYKNIYNLTEPEMAPIGFENGDTDNFREPIFIVNDEQKNSEIDIKGELRYPKVEIKEEIYLNKSETDYLMEPELDIKEENIKSENIINDDFRETNDEVKVETIYIIENIGTDN